MDTEIRWVAQAYTQKNKHPDWYWAIGVIALVTAVFAIIYDNYFFGILVILGAVSIIYFDIKEPPFIEISIQSTGVLVNDHFYPYERIKSFCVNTEEHELYIILDRTVLNRISVSMADASPELIQETLLHYLPEKQEQKTDMDKILDHIGF